MSTPPTPSSSGSSKSLRERLKIDFVRVPEINDRIEVSRCIELCRRLNSAAERSLAEDDLQNAYIDLQKLLQMLLERLPRHAGFAALPATDANKQWVRSTRQSALGLLERVCQRMDEVEDEDRRQQQRKSEVQIAVVAPTPLPTLADVDSDHSDSHRSNRDIVFENSLNQQTLQVTEEDLQVLSLIGRSSTATSGRTTTAVGANATTTNVSPLPLTNTQSTPPSTSTSNVIRNVSFDILRHPADMVISSANGASAAPTERKPILASAAATATVPTSYLLPDRQLSRPKGMLQSAMLAHVHSMPTLSPFALRVTSEEDRNIVKLIVQQTHGFRIPQPTTSVLRLTLSSAESLEFCRDDFHASFAGFLSFLPVDLQLAKSAVEANRCFFVHLGVAIGVHPFLLQIAFRELAASIKIEPDCWYDEIVQTMSNYCSLIDANALCFIWPQELEFYRLLIISGDCHEPLFSVFTPASSSTEKSDAVEVILHCSGSHFTLLKPVEAAQSSHRTVSAGFHVIDSVLARAKAHHKVVNEYTVQPNGAMPTIRQILQRMLRS